MTRLILPLLLLLASCEKLQSILPNREVWRPSYSELAYNRAVVQVARNDDLIDVRDILQDSTVKPVAPQAAPVETQPLPDPILPLHDYSGIIETIKTELAQVSPPTQPEPGAQPVEKTPVLIEHAVGKLRFWCEMHTQPSCVPCRVSKGQLAKLKTYKTGGQLDATAHIRIVEHADEEPITVPQFTFWHQRSDGEIVQVGEPHIGGLNSSQFTNTWAVRVALVDKFNADGWPVSAAPVDNVVWSQAGERIALAFSGLQLDEKSLPSQTIPMTAGSFFDQLLMALGGTPIEVAPGVTVTATNVNVSIRREGDRLVVMMQEPKPQITIKRFLKITTTFDGITIVDGEARLHFGKVPAWLEPRIPLNLNPLALTLSPALQ